MPESSKAPNYSIDCHDVVHVVEFSPFEWSSQLIAIGTGSRVSVGTCRFQVTFTNRQHYAEDFLLSIGLNNVQ